MKLTKPIYVYLIEPGEFDKADSYHATCYESTVEHWVLAHTGEIEFTPIDRDVATAAGVAALNAEREKVREEFNKRMAQIQEQISKLQALTYSE